MTNPDPSSTSGSRPAWHICALVLAILAAFFVIDRAIGFLLDAAYTRSGYSPLAQVQYAQADTVVVGTSTAKAAFDPRHWASKMVNIAQDGQSVLFSIAATLAMERASSVKRVVIGIDPQDLLTKMSDPSAKRIWRIAPLVYTLPEVAPMLDETRPFTEAPIALASWRFRGAVEKILRKVGKAAPPPFRELPVASVAEPKLDRSPLSDVPRINEGTARYLSVLRNFIKNSDVQLIFVVTPAYKNKRFDLPTQAALIAALRDRLAGAQVCDLMDFNSPVLDEFRRDPKNFFDNVHLSGRGAPRYTEIMADVISEKC